MIVIPLNRQFLLQFRSERHDEIKSQTSLFDYS